MFGKLRQKFREYSDRNERAHALVRFQVEDLEQYTALPLLTEVGTSLEEFSGSGLWIVELFNDDITPIEYVVYIIQRFSKRDKEQATFLALTVHGKGSAPLAVGAQSTIEAIAKQIAEDASEKAFPLKCAVRAV